MYVTVPSVLAWWLGKDDEKIQNLPEWRKTMAWNFSWGDSVYSFPKPFQLGLVYGTTVEKALDYIYHKDPTAITKWFRAVFDSSVFRQEMVSFTALKPIAECMTNYSWMRKSPLEN
jgi:hypothetical protein